MSAHKVPEPEPGYSVQALLAACDAAKAVSTPPKSPDDPAAPDDPDARTTTAGGTAAPEADAA